jgi:hypothetical protein
LALPSATRATNPAAAHPVQRGSSQIGIQPDRIHALSLPRFGLALNRPCLRARPGVLNPTFELHTGPPASTAYRGRTHACTPRPTRACLSFKDSTCVRGAVHTGGSTRSDPRNFFNSKLGVLKRRSDDVRLPRRLFPCCLAGGSCLTQLGPKVCAHLVRTTQSSHHARLQCQPRHMFVR